MARALVVVAAQTGSVGDDTPRLAAAAHAMLDEAGRAVDGARKRFPWWRERRPDLHASLASVG